MYAFRMPSLVPDCLLWQSGLLCIHLQVESFGTSTSTGFKPCCSSELNSSAYLQQCEIKALPLTSGDLHLILIQYALMISRRCCMQKSQSQTFRKRARLIELQGLKRDATCARTCLRRGEHLCSDILPFRGFCHKARRTRRCTWWATQRREVSKD